MIILIVVLTLLVVLPLLRCTVKRLRLRRRIVRLCKKRNFRLHAAHPFWFFGSKYFHGYDFCIETKDERLFVKLFGVKRYRTTLVLLANGMYHIRRYLIMMAFTTEFAIFIMDGRKKRLPDYRFGEEDESGDQKRSRRILLVNPVSMTIRRQTANGSEINLRSGDVFNEMEIFSLSDFLESF